jgi:hypothetical protein
MHCWMLHRQCQMILMWSRVWEWAYVLLMNTSCLHLQSFCAVGDSNNWATGFTLTGVSWRKFGKSNTQGKYLLSLPYYTTWLLFGSCLMWYTQYNCRSVFAYHTENVWIIALLSYRFVWAESWYWDGSLSV